VKANVRVHYYYDCSMAIFPGPRQIGRNDASGHMQQEDKQIAA
jgi:hypothetical protein